MTFIGITLIFILLYRYLFLERFPYMINEHVSWWVIFIITFILIVHIITLNNYRRQWYKYKPSKISELITKIMAYIYYKPIHAAGQYILNHSYVSKITLESGGALLYTLKNKLSVYIVNIPLLLLPKAIIAFSLFADVFILHQIHTLYQILWVSLITLIFQAELGLITIEISKRKQILENNSLTVEIIDNHYQLSSKNSTTLTEFNLLKELWYHYENILDAIRACYLCQKTKYYFIFNILITTIFILSWSYYLYMVLSAKHLATPPNVTFIIWLRKYLLGI